MTSAGLLQMWIEHRRKGIGLYRALVDAERCAAKRSELEAKLQECRDALRDLVQQVKP